MRRVSVSKILFQGKSKLKLVLAAIGVTLSMVVISIVFQVFMDLNQLLEKGESEDGFNYVQISKEIGLTNTLGLSSSNFSQKEIRKIKAQKFIEDVGELWSNDFRVYGEFAGIPFDMFLTSVEGDFIDADTISFGWEEGQRELPVIVSNQFLSLLNHAVLPSQGRLPIPKMVIKKALVSLNLSKNGKKINQLARVVGFSDRVNSVLVPKKFLDFANKKLAGTTNTRVSFLILKLKDSSSKQFKSFLNRNDYEVSGELPFIDDAKSIIKIAIPITFIFGFIMLALSLSLNYAQFKLVIAENKERVRMFKLLGYSTKSIVLSVMKSGLISFGLAVVLSFFLLIPFIAKFHSLIASYKLGRPELNLITIFIPVLIASGTLINLRMSLIRLIRD